MTDLSRNSAWRRSSEHKVIAGVCGGLAQSWGTNPNLIRLVWVVASLWTQVWLGVLLYIALTILLPEGEGTDKTIEVGWTLGRNSQRWMGLVLMLLGGWWLLDRFFPDIVGEVRKVAIPLILIAIGLWVVLKDYKREEGE